VNRGGERENIGGEGVNRGGKVVNRGGEGVNRAGEEVNRGGEGVWCTIEPRGNEGITANL